MVLELSSVASLAAMLLFGFSVQAANLDGHMNDDRADVSGSKSGQPESDGTRTYASSPTDIEVKWAFVCTDRDNTFRDGFGDCDEPGPDVELCVDGSAQLTQWRRERGTATVDGWSLWYETGATTCLSAGLPGLTLTDFQSLPIAPSPVQVQPPHGWTFVNIDTIVHTTNDPQYLSTTLLGHTVEVRATPAQFTWDFGDGTPPLTTTDPGAPWPHHTLAHTYRTTGTYTITLTTHWTGHYRLTGTPTWHPIHGTATTTTTTNPLTTHTAHPHLIHEPT